MIEKILERLEEEREIAEKELEKCIFKGLPYHDSTEGKIIGIKEAIEIVKHGGVSDDVCEWEFVSDGEFIQNPHTKRLYSNEPSMKNIYCNTCGKKIKVVE